MSWRLIENDESTTAAVCNFEECDTEANIRKCKRIADELIICSGCAWWENEDSLDVLYLFHTSIPVCYIARILIRDLVIPFYAPSVSFLRRVSSNWHVAQPVSSVKPQPHALLSRDLFRDEDCLAVLHSVVHFRRLRSPDQLNSLPFIGGYSWWRTEDGYNARAWFTKKLDNADSHISNAVFPTKRDDILALISRNLSHVAIELDPFAGFLKGLPAPTSKLKSRKHEYLSSYLGPVFELGDAIAKGAYGEVFKATRTVNGIAIVMALKVFDHKISESDVRAEFAILQRLQQFKVAGIPKTFDLLIFSDGPKCIGTEFISHDSFQSFVRIANLDDARMYMKALLISLEGVHRTGIIHRDVKPSNFLYSREKNLGWLIDFGMAIPAKTLPDRRGTRGFRAPEVLRGSLIQTQAIDVWSAGIVFLTLLCRGKVDTRISSPASDTAAAKTLGIYFGQDYSKYDEDCEPLYGSWRHFVSKQNRPMCADGKALDLLESMLHALPSKRIQAEFALTHEFFRGECLEMMLNAGDNLSLTSQTSPQAVILPDPTSSTEVTFKRVQKGNVLKSKSPALPPVVQSYWNSNRRKKMGGTLFQKKTSNVDVS